MNKAEYLQARELVRGNGFFYANRFWTEEQKTVFYRLGWGKNGLRRDHGDRLQRRAELMKISKRADIRIKKMLITTNIKHVDDRLFSRHNVWWFDREF